MRRLSELTEVLRQSATHTEVENGTETVVAEDHYVEIAALSQMLEELEQRERDENIVVTDAPTLNVLRQSFARVQKICNEYMEAHPEDQTMREITELIADGREAFGAYNPGLEHTIEDILDPEKRAQLTNAVNINLQNRVGGSVSSRIPSEVDGRRGFFTQETPSGRVSAFLRDTADGLDPDRVYMKDLIAAFDTEKGRTALALSLAEGKQQSLFRYYHYSGDDGKETERRRKAADDYLRRLFDDAGIPESVRKQAMRSENFYKDIDEALFDPAMELNGIRGEAMNAAYAGIRLDSNIEKRNVAVSRTADMLGISGSIAYATTSSADINGVRVDGIFMENAEGQETTGFYTRQVDNGHGEGMDYNEAGVIRQASDIQALDYICGNNDRHDKNFMIRYDEKARKITGIVGIDNDMSFGNMDPGGMENGKRFMAGPDNMLLMRRSTADRIMNLQKESFSRQMQGLIREDEMESAWKRVEKLQDKIAESMRGTGGPEDDLSRGKLRLLADNDPLWEKTSIRQLSAQAGSSSIFRQLNKTRIFTDNPMTNDPLKSRPRAADININIKEFFDGDQERLDTKALMDLYRHRKGLSEADIDCGYDYYQREIGSLVDGAAYRADINRKLGIQSTEDCIYCDGKPVRDVLKEQYGLKDDQLQGRSLRANIAMLATSGRHQLSLATIQKGDDGKLFVNVSDINMDLKPLDKYKGMFGTARSERAEKLAKKARLDREQRFTGIRQLIEKQCLEKTGSPLNPVEAPVAEAKAPAGAKAQAGVKEGSGKKRIYSLNVKNISLNEMLKKETGAAEKKAGAKKAGIRRSNSLSADRAAGKKSQKANLM
ncbi:MAG: hypothetical protein J5966_10070 [Lachnospiraceae bacterium]|nr:hypothetical protein [Lachnospiraceae bacterium]